MYVSNVKVTGTCDGEGCSEPAKFWFGQTSMAHCGKTKCESYLSKRWQECYEQIERDAKQKLEDEFANTPIQDDEDGG